MMEGSHERLSLCHAQTAADPRHDRLHAEDVN
jgi:hypothetical protein